jgi:hypothetical protein
MIFKLCLAVKYVWIAYCQNIQIYNFAVLLNWRDGFVPCNNKIR